MYQILLQTIDGMKSTAMVITSMILELTSMFQTHMQFLAARSLCTKFCKARYSIPLAICKHRLRRSLCTGPS